MLRPLTSCPLGAAEVPREPPNLSKIFSLRRPALVLGIACLGFNLVFGTTGLLSLGHAAYFGLGAYPGAFLFNVADLHSLEAYLLLGVITATAAAARAGAWCVCATRTHFSILTLAVAQLVHALFVSGAVYRPLGDNGKGLFYVGYGASTSRDSPSSGRACTRAVHPDLLRRHPAGPPSVARRTLACQPLPVRDGAPRDPRQRCPSRVHRDPVRAYRWRAFVISGAVVGLAGGLHGQLTRQVTPDQLHWLFSAQLARRHDHRGPMVPRSGPRASSTGRVRWNGEVLVPQVSRRRGGRPPKGQSTCFAIPPTTHLGSYPPASPWPASPLHRRSQGEKLMSVRLTTEAALARPSKWDP